MERAATQPSMSVDKIHFAAIVKLQTIQLAQTIEQGSDIPNNHPNRSPDNLLDSILELGPRGRNRKNRRNPFRAAERQELHANRHRAW